MADFTLVNYAVADGRVTSLACNKPTNTAEKDIMIALVLHGGQGDTLGTMTPPSGWTEAAMIVTDSIRDFRVYYKVAGSSEASSFTWSISLQNYLSITIATYRNGFDTNDPIDVISSTATNPNESNASLIANGINVSSVGSNIVFLGGVSSGLITFNVPNGLDNDWVEDVDSKSSSSYWSRTFSHCNWSGSGNTGNQTSSMSASIGGKYAFLIALNPAPDTNTGNFFMFF